MRTFHSSVICRNISLASANLKLFSFQLVDIPRCEVDETPQLISEQNQYNAIEPSHSTSRLISRLGVIPSSALTNIQTLQQFVGTSKNAKQTFLISRKAFKNFLHDIIKASNHDAQLAIGGSGEPQNLLGMSSSTLPSASSKQENTLIPAHTQHMMSVLNSLHSAPSKPFQDIATVENKVRTRMFSQTASRNTLEEFPPPSEAELALIEASGAGKTASVQAILTEAYKRAIAAFGVHSSGKSNAQRMRAYEYDNAWSDAQFLVWVASARGTEPSPASVLRASPFLDVQVNSQLEKGGSALHYAAVAGRLDVARMLLEHGADVNLPAGNGSTPLHWAAGNGQLEMVQLLVASGADPLRTTSTWCVDVFGKNSGQTALHWAAGSGHAACVSYLHALAPETIAAVDEKENTPLTLAQKDVHLPTVRLIKDALSDDYVAVQIHQHDYNMSRVMMS